MRVAITGASGLIGRSLQERLRLEGHQVTRLVRRRTVLPDEVEWDPSGVRAIEPGALDGIDGAVHLAGEGVAAKRWTERQKTRILESRRTGTRVLSEALASLDPRPSVLVSASAIGYYDATGDAIVNEFAPPGDDFLAGVCRAWEEATQPAEAAGIRVVHLRSGIVQSSKGGALGRQLLPFRLGLGGRIGDGNQWVSWISLDDEVGAIIHCLTHSAIHGAVNATAPEPVTNADYAKALGQALHRPAVLPLPTAALGVLLGAELVSSLLTSQRVAPQVLLDSGYAFQHRTIHEGLEAALRK